MCYNCVALYVLKEKSSMNPPIALLLKLCRFTLDQISLFHLLMTSLAEFRQQGDWYRADLCCFFFSFKNARLPLSFPLKTPSTLWVTYTGCSIAVLNPSERVIWINLCYKSRYLKFNHYSTLQYRGPRNKVDREIFNVYLSGPILYQILFGNVQKICYKEEL